MQPRLTRERVSGYRSLGHMVAAVANQVFTPPETISVAAAAEKYLKIETAGAWAAFRNSVAPYMVEPMNVTESRDRKGCVFVSSAQSGKTASLILNKMAYNIRVSGMDMMIVCQSGGAATDFAVRRVDRVISHNEELKTQLLQVRNSDNQKRKHFKSGMLLTLAHPAKNELSGKPVGCVALTDYDRMDDDIDGEGSAWVLASKRTQTFQSYAMTIAESSPSRPVKNPKKVLSHHEAPDCNGILELYNRGDRRMWYWPCPACDEYFSPKWEMLRWDEDQPSHKDQADTVRMHCPHCDHPIHPDDRHGMQQWGLWLAAVQHISGGVVTGDARRSTIASFWLEGTAASFATWPELVEKYLDAQKKFEDTTDDKDLLGFFNVDLGRPYVPKSQESLRTPEILMSRKERLPDRMVPEGVVCLVNCIDVQKAYFDVQTHGILPGNPFDVVIVDRFRVTYSADRRDETGGLYHVRPSTYQEDWDLLREQVMYRTWPLADGSGRRMQARMTFCDAGGHAERGVRSSGSGGVYEKATNFYRKLTRDGEAARFHLVRGAQNRGGKLAWIDRPNGNSGPLGIARGDVPILYFNSNDVKDILNNRLDVVEPAKGMIRFPDWLEDWFFAELCAETWSPERGWENKRRERNESWDLLYYLIGSSFSPLLPMERVNWDNPPVWLKPWDDNPFVLPAPEVDDGPVVALPRAFERRKKVDFAELARKVG